MCNDITLSSLDILEIHLLTLMHRAVGKNLVTPRHTFPRMHQWYPQRNVELVVLWEVVTVLVGGEYLWEHEEGQVYLSSGTMEHSWIRSCLLGWWNPLVICHSSNMESQLYPCGRPQEMLLSFQELHMRFLHLGERVLCVICWGLWFYMCDVCWRNRQRSRLISRKQPWHS